MTNDIAPSVIINPQELTQHPLNSNTHPQSQIEALAASRDILGQYRNIVLWESGQRLEVESKGKTAVLEPGIKYVLAGNGFLQAAILRGEQEIEVKDRSDLTFEESVLLMETDNASPLGSKPDPVRMRENLERAKGLIADNPRMSAMMNRAREMAGISGNGTRLPAEPPEVTQTEAERLAEVYGTRLGQVWQLGRHTIACVDSTDEETVKGLVGDGHMGMVWADPPYGINEETNRKEKGRGKLTQSIDWSPVLGDDKSFDPLFLLKYNKKILWGANYYADKLPESSSWIIWDKRDGVASDDNADCEMAWTDFGGPARIFRHLWKGMIKASEHGQRRVHPTQKPVALADWCFAKYGNPNDIIFDPFLGSGISVLAVEELNDGRKVIGCELAPEYIAVTIQRWVDLTSGEPKLLTS